MSDLDVQDILKCLRKKARRTSGWLQTKLEKFISRLEVRAQREAEKNSESDGGCFEVSSPLQPRPQVQHRREHLSSICSSPEARLPAPAQQAAAPAPATAGGGGVAAGGVAAAATVPQQQQPQQQPAAGTPQRSKRQGRVRFDSEAVRVLQEALQAVNYDPAKLKYKRLSGTLGITMAKLKSKARRMAKELVAGAGTAGQAPQARPAAAAGTNAAARADAARPAAPAAPPPPPLPPPPPPPPLPAAAAQRPPRSPRTQPQQPRQAQPPARAGPGSPAPQGGQQPTQQRATPRKRPGPASPDGGSKRQRAQAQPQTQQQQRQRQPKQQRQQQPDQPQPQSQGQQQWQQQVASPPQSQPRQQPQQQRIQLQPQQQQGHRIQSQPQQQQQQQQQPQQQGQLRGTPAVNLGVAQGAQAGRGGGAASAAAGGSSPLPPITMSGKDVEIALKPPVLRLNLHRMFRLTPLHNATVMGLVEELRLEPPYTFIDEDLVKKRIGSMLSRSPEFYNSTVWERGSRACIWKLLEDEVVGVVGQLRAQAAKWKHAMATQNLFL